MRLSDGVAYSECPSRPEQAEKIPGNRYTDYQAYDRSETKFDGKKRLTRKLHRSPTSKTLAEIGEFVEAYPELVIAQTRA